MSLITSCPACGTMFRVVTDQLKISEGWVRCGHCGDVFDASANLSDESVLVEPPTAEGAARPANPPARPPEPSPRADEVPTQPDRIEPPRPQAPAPAAADSSEPSSFFGDSQSLEPSPLDTPFVFRRSDLLVHPDRDSVLPPVPEQPSELPEEDGEAEEPTRAELKEVSFVREARRRARWSRPGMRILLVIASIALAALLVLQVAYRDRDRLALSQPSLRPALESMCAMTGCSLGAPRQIESVVIESSGFNRLRSDTYRLAFTLRNTARVQVAAPAMELTITDAQDQPIARRVILPEQFGLPGKALPAAGDWSGAVGIVVAPAGSSQVAGYRLLAFYP